MPSGVSRRSRGFVDTSHPAESWPDRACCWQRRSRRSPYPSPSCGGKDFFGIFSASNTPDPANFPQGVTYQRNHDFAAKRLMALDGVTTVPASIDPFFFKVTQ